MESNKEKSWTPWRYEYRPDAKDGRHIWINSETGEVIAANTSQVFPLIKY